MKDLACALPGCDVVFPLRTFSYKLGGHPHVYCSGACVQKAFDLMKRGMKFAKSNKVQAGKENEVRQDAGDFGGSGVTRNVCDRPGCEKPIGTPGWRSRSGGEYCSNKCLQSQEEEEIMAAAKPKKVEEEEVEQMGLEDVEDYVGPADADDEEEDDAPPVIAGKKGSAKVTKPVAKAKPVAKTAAKPVAAKPAAKAAKKVASAVPLSRRAYADDAVIRVLKGADLNIGRQGSNSRLAMSKLKDGLTVGKYRASLKALDEKHAGYAAWYSNWALKHAEAHKLITVK